MKTNTLVRFGTAAVLLGAFSLFSGGAAAQQLNRNLVLAPSGATQVSEQRLALIVGNAAYPGDARLRNPVNDAEDIANVLKDLGFKVTLVQDADRRTMRAAIQNFSYALRADRGGIGLFYFAGHGIMSKGRNFLVPISKQEIEDEDDLESQAVDANSVLAGMEEAGNRVNIVVLDACRNNPFARGFRSAGAGGGLAQMNAPSGTFVAFATSPNSVAADGAAGSRNGIFTKHLLENLKNGDSDIDRVFNRTTAGVAEETRKRQVPWKQASLTNQFRFRNDEPSTTGGGGIDPKETALWTSVSSSSNPNDIDKYLLAYPAGAYAAVAKSYKSKLIDDVRFRDEQQKKFDAERQRLEEERRSQQARIEQERRNEQARMDQERRRMEEERRQQDARAQQERKNKGRSFDIPITP